MTSRSIKKDGPTYNRLVQACEKNTMIKSTDKTKTPYKTKTPNKPKTRTKSVIIQVIGLGCSTIKKDEIAQYELEKGKYFGMKCQVFCNKSLGKTLVDIAKTYCHIVPSKKDKFVLSIVDVVKTYVNEGVKVHLFGYSYGGSVVSRVAEILDASPLKNVHMYTCGSIYVPKPELTRNVDLTHYMFVNDVALKCNGLKNKEAHVVWLRPTNYVTPEKKKRSIFGTSEEWEAHNSYKFEREIIKGKKIVSV